MRQPLIALGVVVLLIGAGALAYVLGVGRLAPPTAPGSVVFVAISRSSDEADAHEIEAIDLEAGTRDLFDLGRRITALAVSADRRSLYVGLDAGRIALLDATTGLTFGQVDLGGPTIVSLVPSADGSTLYAIAVTNIASSIVPIDLATRKAGDPITFAQPVGPAVLRGDTLLVPLGDVRGIQVAFVDVKALSVTSRLTLPRGSLVTPMAFPINGTRTGIVAVDPSGSGVAGLRLYAMADQAHWSDVLLQMPPTLSGRQIGFSLQAVAAANGTIHVCAVAAGTAARRYVVTADLKATSAGTDCGPLAGGDLVVMGKRDPAQLLVLDQRTGKTARTLPLAGVPARLVH